MQYTTTHVKRRVAAVIALLVATSGLAVAIAAPSSAAPRPLAAPGGSGDDGEGGSKSLTDQLDAASRGFLEAKDALARSKARQQQLAAKLKTLDAQLAPRQAALDVIVQQTYRTGRLGPMSALLTADSTGSMMDRAEMLESLAVKQDATLRDLKDTRTAQAQAKTAIDASIRDQQKQVNLMARRQTEAENALKAAGGGQDATSPGGTTGSSNAPKYGGGGGDSATVDDPTSGGRITARLLNAMKQAQAAGFTHYVHGYRPQNSGEHPKGRACDFAADKGGFGGVATGASKDYGNRLANYFIHNSSNLGVLYVIWFRRIWLPSSGWKSYSGGNGDPSSDHTNHVHLSVI